MNSGSYLAYCVTKSMSCALSVHIPHRDSIGTGLEMLMRAGAGLRRACPSMGTLPFFYLCLFLVFPLPLIYENITSNCPFSPSPLSCCFPLTLFPCFYVFISLSLFLSLSFSWLPFSSPWPLEVEKAQVSSLTWYTSASSLNSILLLDLS